MSRRFTMRKIVYFVALCNTSISSIVSTSCNYQLQADDLLYRNLIKFHIQSNFLERS